MENLLRNPDFELPGSGDELQLFWYPPNDGPQRGYYTSITPPRDWSVFWRERFPSVGDMTKITGRPEVKHFHRDTDPVRVATGIHSMQMFTFWRPHDMGAFQTVAVGSGVYQADALLHTWYSECDSKPHTFPLDTDCLTDIRHWAACYLTVGICPNGGQDPYAPSVQWSAQHEIYGQYGPIIQSPEVISTGGRLTVFVRSLATHALKHCDIYIDNVQCVRVADTPGGGPRVPYDRTYNLIPQDATLARAKEIFAIGWQAGRQTSGGSADDAMLSPEGMGQVKAVLWDIPQELHGEYEEFRDQYYPSANLIFKGVGPEPPPEPPDPPIPPSSDNYLGLHLQTGIPGMLEYVRDAKPSTIKLVEQFELARVIKSVDPRIIVVARHWIAHQAPFLDNPDPTAAAREFLGQFLDSLRANEDYIDYVEGLNETIATHDLPGIAKAVAFEVAFADVLAESGINVKPCLLNTAVGNPDHGDETAMLLDVAAAAVRYGGAIGYHGYWWSDPQEDGLLSWWRHHAGRAMESWDETFVSHGLRPKYLLTEVGAVGTTDKGPSLRANDGWRAATCIQGNWERYRAQLLQFNNLIAAWNADNDNRVLGSHIFTSGIGVGWEHFQIGENELRDLAEVLG